jgi:hypothetical protein
MYGQPPQKLRLQGAVVICTNQTDCGPEGSRRHKSCKRPTTLPSLGPTDKYDTPRMAFTFRLGQPYWRPARMPCGTEYWPDAAAKESFTVGVRQYARAPADDIERSRTFFSAGFFCVGYMTEELTNPNLFRTEETDGYVPLLQSPNAACVAIHQTGDDARTRACVRGGMTGFWVRSVEQFLQLLDYPMAYHYSTSTDTSTSRVTVASLFLELLNEKRKQAVFEALTRRTAHQLAGPPGPSVTSDVVTAAIAVCTHLFRVGGEDHDLGRADRQRCVAFAIERIPWESMDRGLFQAAAECVNALGCQGAAGGHALRWTTRLAKYGERFRRDDGTAIAKHGTGPQGRRFAADTAHWKLRSDNAWGALEWSPKDEGRRLLTERRSGVVGDARNCMAYSLAGQTDPSATDPTIAALVESWIPDTGCRAQIQRAGHESRVTCRPTDATSHLQYLRIRRQQQVRFLEREFAGTPRAQVAASPLETIMKHNRLARSVRSGRRGVSRAGPTSTTPRPNDYRIPDVHESCRTAQCQTDAHFTADHRHWAVVTLAPLFRHSVGACFARLHITRVMLGRRERTNPTTIPHDIIEATCAYAVAPARWEHELRSAFRHLQNLEVPLDQVHRRFTRSFAGAAADASDRLIAQVCYTLGISEYGLVHRSRERRAKACRETPRAVAHRAEGAARIHRAKRRRDGDGFIDAD